MAPWETSSEVLSVSKNAESIPISTVVYICIVSAILITSLVLLFATIVALGNYGARNIVKGLS